MIDAHLAPYDMAVELTLFPPEEGGRETGFYSGYRGGHIFLDKIRWMAHFYLVDRNILNPGETALVFVTFIGPEPLVGRLQPDKAFL